MIRFARPLAIVGILACTITTALAAQDGYRQPPEPIARILDAQPTPLISMSPDRSMMLVLEREALPPLSEVSAPYIALAGNRIDPRTNGRFRETTFRALQVRDVRSGEARQVNTPSDARISHPAWSVDGAHIAFTIVSDSGVSLWVADVASGRSRQLTPSTLNAAYGAPCEWFAARPQLVCRFIPEERDAPPQRASVPTGPVIQESEGRAAPARTYQDLLQNPGDEALFEHYFASQVAIVSLDGITRSIGDEGLHASVDPSPDGRYILVETIQRPYSYIVPRWRFPLRTQVWDTGGRVIARLADRPLQEEVPLAFDAVPAGMRALSWRNDVPATLVWIEALDGGDPARAAEKRDRVLMLPAPFTGQPIGLLDVEHRAAGVTWARDDLAIVVEQWWRTRSGRTWAVNPSRPDAVAQLLFERSTEDRYADPGRFVTDVGPLGTRILLTSADGRSAFLVGQGASPEGDRPFLDRIDLASGRTERLWRSAAPHYEEVVAVLDNRGRQVITRRESTSEVPNYFLRDLGSRRVTQLTRFTDPAPEFAGVSREMIRYTRADGVELSATLYLPAGYDRSKGPLPFLLWAYPREFRSAAAAAQVSGSPHRFARPSGASHLFLLTQGYGILDGPTMPIIGEGDEEPNDRYVEQLVASAEAAVDAIVERGIADRERIAIGGHSYGAFMTANLLAHSAIFRAGIARSGAYNRTLTPFGFQAEERPFWQAREVYMRMSPFTYADRIRAPILFIHGEADNNSGTFPVQSERMYAAVRGNGGTARLVLLPAESHGYAARESVGHALWEMVTWLDRWVKNAGVQAED